jgi:hypothetical protein
MEAIEGPDWEKWLEAMKFEIGSMYHNQVWNLVNIPYGRKAVGNKWILKKKIDGGYIKLDLSQRVFDKFKELTTITHSHP